MRSRSLRATTLIAGLLLPLHLARACSGRWPNRDAAHDWPGRFVDSATAVVRVRVVGADSSAPGPEYPPVPWIKPVAFAVLEWLRPPAGVAATGWPARLVLAGALVERDDYNAGAVPYTFVRSDGARGACVAYAYRVGGEYLLLLRPNAHADAQGAPGTSVGDLTPYWAALAPVNEQVRDGRDPWVAWVRDRITAARVRAGERPPA